METVTRSCPLCGSSRLAPTLQVRDLNSKTTDHVFGLVTCACGMALLNPMPADLGSFYPDSYDAHRELDAGSGKRKGSQRFARLEGLPPGSLLDVGCGSGYDLIAMRDRGWRVMGVEIDPRAAERGRQAGLDIRSGTLEEARLPDAAFDAVTLFHVLEHLPDPVRVVREVARVLRPGGVMLAQVPNFEGINAKLFREWWYELDVPRHVNFFTPATALDLVRRAGLLPASLRTIESAANFRRSLRHRTGVTLGNRGLRFLLRQFFRTLNLFRTGDMLEIVGRKPGLR